MWRHTPKRSEAAECEQAIWTIHLTDQAWMPKLSFDFFVFSFVFPLSKRSFYWSVERERERGSWKLMRQSALQAPRCATSSVRCASGHLFTNRNAQHCELLPRVRGRRSGDPPLLSFVCSPVRVSNLSGFKIKEKERSNGSEQRTWRAR